jgi:hypothetical protein
MLDNFSKSTKGSSALSKLVNEHFKSQGSADTAKAAGPGVDGIGSGMETPAAKIANQEIIMEALMRKYEDEMQSPVQGFLFGNLVTSMLIQVA